MNKLPERIRIKDIARLADDENVAEDETVTP